MLQRRHRETVRTVGTVHEAGSGRRLPATVWTVLVWAYGAESVRHAGGVGDFRAAGRGGSSTGVVCDVGAAGVIGPGHNGMRGGKPAAHDDAEWIAGLVDALDRRDRWLVVDAAESGMVPEWDRAFDACRLVPVLRANGKPKVLLDPRTRYPSACLLKVEGWTPAEQSEIVERLRERYTRFVEVLGILRENLIVDCGLTRWEITSIGVHPRPWDRK